MSVVISLREVINEMAEIADQHSAFLNRTTGELFTIDDQQRALFENSQPIHELSEGQHEMRKAMEAGDLLELPNKFEHHEFSIIERFCDTVSEPKHKKKLARAIRGKRAFRDFQKVVAKLGLQERWIGFRNRELESVATDWLDHHEIVYDQAA
jgi:hypothetical protein